MLKPGLCHGFSSAVLQGRLLNVTLKKQKYLFQGNYFGAVKGWVDHIHQTDQPPDSNIFAIVDLHAITLPQNPGEIGARQSFRLLVSELAYIGI